MRRIRKYLIVLAVTCSVSVLFGGMHQAHAALIVVQHPATTNATNNNTISLTVSATGSHNLLVVICGEFGNSRTVTRVSDGTNNFSHAPNSSSGIVNTGNLDTWYLPVSTAGKTTITCTYSGASTFKNIFFWEVSGFTHPVVDTAGGADTGTSGTTGSVGTVRNGVAVTTTAPGFITGAEDCGGCAGHAGNEFAFDGDDGSGNGFAALVSSTAGFHQPVWDDSGAGTSAPGSTAAFKENSNKAGVSLYGPSTLYSGLMGWWTFDGKNLQTNVKDSSGQGNNGFLLGSAATATSSVVVEGKIGQALHFDGSTAVTTTEVGTAMGNSVKGLSAVTVSAWLYPTAYNSNGPDIYFEPIAGTNANAGTTRFNCAMNANGTVNMGGRTPDGGSPTTWVNTTTPIPLNKWTLVTCVEVANSPALVYYNGSLAGMSYTGTSNPNAAFTNSNPATVPVIGSELDTNIYDFDGNIDDVRIYSRTLSAQEVTELYNTTAGAKTNVSQVGPQGLNSGLVGWWTFDGKNLQTNVKDSSGNGNNGFLLGNAATATSSAVIEGKIGQALHFDGSTAATTTEVGTAMGNSVKGLSAVTVSAWLYPTAYNSNGPDIYFEPIAGTNANAGTTRFNCAMNANGTVNMGGRTPDGGSPTTWVNTTTPIPLNKWTLVTCVEVANSPALVYYNGSLAGMSYTGTSNPNAAFTNSNPATVPVIGSELDTNIYDFDGNIDDVRVYNRVLSAQEVLQLYRLNR